MIALSLPAEFQGDISPALGRLTTENPNSGWDLPIRQSGGDLIIDVAGGVVRLLRAEAADFEGDVVLLAPEQGQVHRLVRARSRHNTFLVTERCDQLCVMCSQPPKKTHVDQFGLFKAAALLAPPEATLGISGGEPTLFKQELFDLIGTVAERRPDIRFHVLSNAQHFEEADIAFLRGSAGQRVTWGVPIYATDADLHDQIVGKTGAFGLLMGGLALLGRAAAKLELRTVLLRQNAAQLPQLARLVARKIPFAAPWAIMQLERIGFARNRWAEQFYDHSFDFEPLAEAIEFASVSGVPVRLYNFPLCTLPVRYRRFAPASISDWKRKYEPYCDGCVGRAVCTGFFAWHPKDQSYKKVGHL